jgi:hypothetical protein
MKHLSAKKHRASPHREGARFFFLCFLKEKRGDHSPRFPGLAAHSPYLLPADAVLPERVDKSFMRFFSQNVK